MVFTPHISNWMFQFLSSIKRCWDRKCTCNEKKTRKLTQEDYENVYVGGDFMFEFRYANMLTVLAVTYLYSGGMPILYPVAAMFFFVTYWTDKCLILRCYRKPIKFDDYLARTTLSFFKFILVLHLIGTLVMFDLTPILQTSFFKDDSQTKGFKVMQDGEFSFYSIYFWICVIILVTFLIVTLPFNFCRKFIQRCCCTNKTSILPQWVEFQFEQDFYQCVSYGSLKEKLIKT